MVSTITLDDSSYLPLEPRDSFPFPYATPYEIQTKLMRHVYSAIEERSAAVVESPTGTGKSLSLICSSLTWLLDDALRSRKVAMESLREQLASQNPNEPGWMLEQEVRRRMDELEASERDIEERLAAQRRQKKQRQKEMRSRAHYARKRQRLNAEEVPGKEGDDDEAFAPDHYEEQGLPEDGISPAVRKLMEEVNGKHNVRSKHLALQAEEEEPDTKKVFFTSRTHSQLSQFQNELRKTEFAESVRTIALGSRQNLCINDKLRSGCTSVDALNEKCLDLQKADKGQRCEFLPSLDEPERLENFRDEALSEIHSIEDLEDLGRQTKTCPYYGSRKAIKQAQLVTLPYNLLLLEKARESLGIHLQDNIVIVDEAHNLIDTILSIHSVDTNSTQLSFAKGALLVYLKRFKSRLKGSNATFLKQLYGFMNALDVFCKDWIAEKKADQLVKASDIVRKCGADQTNLRALDRYLTESKIAQKISGYMEALDNKENPKGRQSRSNKISAIHRIQAFLLSLANAEKDGRVLLTLTHGTLHLKYQLLNPSDAFSAFQAARSVIIAGGTMAPLSDFAQQILSYMPQDKVKNLSCSHVIPQDQILVRALATGPSGGRLEFKYEQRGDLKMLDEYGAVLLNICSLVSKGLVVFLPSYATLDLLMQRWSKTATLAKMQQKKKIFLEPKDGAESETVLAEYATAVRESAGGAMLLAVVGAKLSEGINFQDDLCRCVVVIGIPYPSSQSIELKERMKYVSSLPPVDGLPSGVEAGKRLYSNLAFRAVNQSIGRSIRHINDWSAILLLDVRYTLPATQSKLPAWISQNIASPPNFGGLVKDLAKFSKSRSSRAL